MKRLELLGDLEIVSGAIADKDISPVLTHIWFTGKEILAYDSQIGISVKHVSSFKGGVPNSLIELVKVTTANDVELLQNDKALHIKFGARKNPDTLAMLIQNSPFEMPAFVDKEELGVSDIGAFMQSIKCCLRSSSGSIASPEYLGITLIADKRKLKMFSTDNKSISIEEANLKKDAPFKRVIISTPFCKRLVALSGDAKKMKIAINEEYALAVIDDRITIFGHLIGEKDQPLDFLALVEEFVPADYAKHNVEVPERLRQAVARAVIITGEAAGEAETLAKVRDNILILDSNSKTLGRVSDRIKLSDKHPDTQITIQCKALQTDIETFDKMFITDKCWIMMNKTSMYLVSGV